MFLFLKLSAKILKKLIIIVMFSEKELSLCFVKKYNV